MCLKQVLLPTYQNSLAAMRLVRCCQLQGLMSKVQGPGFCVDVTYLVLLFGLEARAKAQDFCMHAPTDVPHYDIDFYSDAVIADPQPHYRAMRALGPVVFLPVHGNYAFTHHQTVKHGLRNHTDFISGEGLSADDFGSNLQRGNVVASDPPRHTAMRKAMLPTLMPKAIGGLRQQFDGIATELVEALVSRAQFDTVTEFASILPLTVVRDLIGLPAFGRTHMLKWASGAFDIAGIQNVRGQKGVETTAEMRDFIRENLTAEDAREGSWVQRIFDLEKNGKLEAEFVPFLIRDYINPSLDTTISAIGHLVHQLAQHPDQWTLLRARPELSKKAISEAVRLGTPIRSFARIAANETRVAGVTIPKGARVMMLFASANRDEAVFENADRFDIERAESDHLGFGHGIHTCVGMHLAQMEMMSLLTAMIPAVGRIETGVAVPAMNNTICGFEALPTIFHRA